MSPCPVVAPIVESRHPPSGETHSVGLDTDVRQADGSRLHRDEQIDGVLGRWKHELSLRGEVSDAAEGQRVDLTRIDRSGNDSEAPVRIRNSDHSPIEVHRHLRQRVSRCGVSHHPGDRDERTGRYLQPDRSNVDGTIRRSFRLRFESEIARSESCSAHREGIGTSGDTAELKLSGRVGDCGDVGSPNVYHGTAERTSRAGIHHRAGNRQRLLPGSGLRRHGSRDRERNQGNSSKEPDTATHSSLHESSAPQPKNPRRATSPRGGVGAYGLSHAIHRNPGH